MVKTILERKGAAASPALLLLLETEMEVRDLLHLSQLVKMLASPILRTLADQLTDETALALIVSRKISDRETIELLKT